MSSKIKTPGEAFVWLWLPGQSEPVVAGRIEQVGHRYLFNYAKSYLERQGAIALYTPELPLRRGAIDPPTGLSMASCLRDGAPDAWGRRVILNRLHGQGSGHTHADQHSEISELTYLLESGSDRAGAIDFQNSPTHYVPRLQSHASYDALMAAAADIEKGRPLSPELAQALQFGTSIGGARPKALIDEAGRKLIAKFASQSDIINVIKAEFLAMSLARVCGLDVAPVQMIEAAGKDVLLVERFDRVQGPVGWHRRAMVSALTILGLDEMMARYASYQDLAELIRHKFTKPKATLRELFGRLCFNILCGNTDDHARNHAAFWDGQWLSLTPAYDICPQGRAGNEASQAMLINGENRMSTLQTCIDAAPAFLLSPSQAVALIEQQIACLADAWQDQCEAARLTQIDQRVFAGRQFLNPFCVQGLVGHQGLIQIFEDARAIVIGQGAGR